MAEQTAIFENNDKAAHAVSRYIDELRPSPQRFALRPYQYQSPAFTEWWFVPGTEWPAYHCSKLFVHRFQVGSEYRLFTGIYVEHGLDEERRGEEGVKQSHVMRPNWYWFEFLYRARSGALDPVLRQVLERSGSSVFVWLDASALVPEPENGGQTEVSNSEVYGPDADDSIEFEVHSADLQFARTYKQDNQVLWKSLNECANLCELAEHLEALQEQKLRWYWANLLIGIRLRYGTISTGTWGAAEIWHNALEPWTPWVRAGSVGQSGW
jgi:hypothetical protein